MSFSNSLGGRQDRVWNRARKATEGIVGLQKSAGWIHLRMELMNGPVDPPAHGPMRGGRARSQPACDKALPISAGLHLASRRAASETRGMEWVILILLVLAFPAVAVALLRGAIAVTRFLVIVVLIGAAALILLLAVGGGAT